MNLKILREKLSPISNLLKTEGDKLRAAHAEVSERYSAVIQEIRAIQEAPPHRSEVAGLLGEALDIWVERQSEEFGRLTGGWTSIPLQSRDEAARRQAVQNLLHLNGPGGSPALMRLLGALDSRARLADIVAGLDWPDGPDPATRAQKLSELESQAATLADQLTEMSQIAESAQVKIR